MTWMRALVQGRCGQPTTTLAAVIVVLAVDVAAATSVLAADDLQRSTSFGGLVLLLALLTGSMILIRQLFQRQAAKCPVRGRSRSPRAVGPLHR